MKCAPGLREPALDIGLREGGPEEARPASGRACRRRCARCRGTGATPPSAAPDRAAGIAGRRLHPDVLEGAVAQDLAVGDAVERHAAGEAQIVERHARARSERASRSITSSVTFWIEAAMSMWNGVSSSFCPVAHRRAEQVGEFLVGHGQAGAIVEIVEIERGTCRRP